MFENQITKLKSKAPEAKVKHRMSIMNKLFRPVPQKAVLKPNMVPLVKRAEPRCLIFTLNPRLGSILGLKRGTKSQIRSSFVRYALNHDLLDKSQSFYLVSKDPCLYKILQTNRIRVEDVFAHLARFVSEQARPTCQPEGQPEARPDGQPEAGSEKAGEEYAKAFGDVGAEEVDNTEVDTKEGEDDDDYKFD